EGLTELGQRQAAALAAWLPQEVATFDAIFCSTMQRARETAAPLAAAYDMPLICDDRLREIGNNRLDHTAWPSDDLPEYSDYWGSERPFSSITPEREQGESLMHFRIRVGNFIEEMVDSYRGRTIAAVCHGGVIEIAFDHVFNIGPWRRCEVWSHNTGVTHFELVDHPLRETWRLHFHSRIEHLAGLEELHGRREDSERG
ncbi:MAG: histidine phosphatase family protein, partial [Candidatus Promineifilaceae bacterium]